MQPTDTRRRRHEGHGGRGAPTPPSHSGTLRQLELRYCPQGARICGGAALLTLLSGNLPGIHLEGSERCGRNCRGRAYLGAGREPQVGAGQDGRPGRKFGPRMGCDEFLADVLTVSFERNTGWLKNPDKKVSYKDLLERKR